MHGEGSDQMLMQHILSMAGASEHGNGLIDQAAKLVGYGWLTVIGLPETLRHVANVKHVTRVKRHKAKRAFKHLENTPNVKVLAHPTEVQGEWSWTNSDYDKLIEGFAHEIKAERIDGLAKYHGEPRPMFGSSNKAYDNEDGENNGK